MMGATLAAMLAVGALFTGCGGNKQPQQPAAVSVKVVPALQQDTPLSTQYAGQVRGLDEVKVLPRVSGTVVEKYVSGGQYVEEGQILYRIDSRQYESAMLSRQATLAQSEATLNNAQLDLQRFEALLAADAISEQSVTTQRAKVREYEAVVTANAALLKKAQEDLDDTKVYAPMAGRLDVNDVAIGTYANAGQTSLVTLGSVDPVYVQFSISETEYLSLVSRQNISKAQLGEAQVTITLSNGTEYPERGRLVQADRALSQNTGTLTVKAIFPNPRGILLPGMFARVRLEGEVAKNAILVPQRSIQQVLDRTFVIVVGEGNKSEARNVVLGEKVGNYYIVKSGVNAGDKVVVEGLTKLRAGMDLSVTEANPEELGLTLADTATPSEKK